MLEAHAAVTPDGKPVAVPIPVARVVTCVISVKEVLIEINDDFDEQSSQCIEILHSAGLILSADNWFAKVQSGDYTLSAITDETSQIPTFLLRKSTDEERKNFLASKEKRGPITLAGFTTGQPLIDFSVSDLNGKVLTKESFAGKILVINFWFKDAAPSKAEIPDLNKNLRDL